MQAARTVNRTSRWQAGGTAGSSGALPMGPGGRAGSSTSTHSARPEQLQPHPQQLLKDPQPRPTCICGHLQRLLRHALGLQELGNVVVLSLQAGAVGGSTIEARCDQGYSWGQYMSTTRAHATLHPTPVQASWQLLPPSTHPPTHPPGGWSPAPPPRCPAPRAAPASCTPPR